MSIQQSGYYPVFSTPNEAAVQATGSTTARALSDRFGEVFHVDDYGAKGDWNGTTGTDDTTAIQNCINAAIAAGGGIIEFEQCKTYFLNTRKQNSFGQTNLGNHLEIKNATTNTKLYFKGNGAKLYSTTYNANGCAILYVCSQWHTLHFEDLIFDRNVAPFTNSGQPTEGIRLVAFDYSRHELLSILRCSFIDADGAVVMEGGALTKTRSKVQMVSVKDTSFLFYKGGGRPDILGAGSVTFGCTQWVDTANFDGIYWDGAVGGKLPSGIGAGKDGFLFPAPRNTIVTNSVFKNATWETLKIGDPTETGGLSALKLNSFTQPAVGSNVTVTIQANTTWNNDFETLTIGDEYAVWDSSRYDIGIVGVYKLISTSNPNYPAGTQLVFQRVNTDSYRKGPEQPEGGTVTGTNPSANTFLVAQKFLDARAHISNNLFVDQTIRLSDNAIVGNPALTGRLGINNVQVLVGCSAIVTGNTFVGALRGVDSGAYSWTSYEPQVIANNVFVCQHEFATQPASAPLAITSGYGNTIIANNQFIAKQSKDIVFFIFQLNAQGTKIINNSFVIEKPDSVPSATRVINFNNIMNVVTGDASNNTLTGDRHDYKNGQQITMPIINGGDGLSAYTPYYVRDVSGKNFKLAATLNGDAIDFTTNITSAFITDNKPIETHIQDNYVSGVDAYANCDPFVTHTVGPYYGKFITGIAVPSSGPIKVARELRSDNGEKWMLRITNDGELEVIK